MIPSISLFGYVVITVSFWSFQTTGGRWSAVTAEAISSSWSSSNYYLNVYGQPLKSCSSEGMALTGYTRTGYCVDQNDDEGSHHICIDLSSTTVNNDGQDNGNFCDVTGQYDWCSSQDMECDTINGSNNGYYESGSGNGNGGGNGGGCAIQNWCVCQWAFASYLDKAGGCDSIQTIVCESINLEAVLAYQEQSAYGKYGTALQCIVDRCGLDMNNLPKRSYHQQQQQQQLHLPSHRSVGFLITIVILASVAFGGIYFIKRRGITTGRRGGSSNMMDVNSKSGLLTS